ncbi:MAG: hypothetical protein K0M40_02500 [Prolixibacteraceae bacterium]|nr:hypothetical protein [Prolixibacteraceae bacterium]
MSKIINILILLCPLQTFSQSTFEKIIGGELPESGHCAIQTNDEGILVIGDDSDDIYIVKADKNGIKIWDKHYGGRNSDHAYDVKQTSDNGYIVVGSTDDFGKYESTNVYILKLNSIGDTLWTKAYGTDFGDYGYSITESLDKGFVITGMTYDYSTGMQNLLILKIDKNGNQKWLKICKCENSYIGKSIIPTNDGNYIILADKPELGGQIINSHLRLFKINQSGDTLWTKVIKKGYSFQAGNIIQTNNNGYLICGTSIGDSSNKPGATDIYLVSLNNKGETIWMKNYGTKDYDFGRHVIQTKDLNYVVVGDFYRHENNNTFTDLVIFKVKRDGSIIWSKNYKSKGYKIPSSVCEAKDLGLLIGGSINNNDGVKFDDMLLLKLDKFGNLNDK